MPGWNCDAVIFDMDGLLVDSERLSYASYVKTAKKHGLPHAFEPYASLIGLNAIEGIPALQKLLPSAMDAHGFKDEWGASYRLMLDEDTPLKPYARDLVRTFAARGTPMAVATSSRGEKARQTLARVGIMPYLVGLTGGDEVPRGKPAPDVYLSSLDMLASAHRGLSKSRVVAFEDSEVGTTAALAAGLRVIQVPDMIPARRPSSGRHRIADNLRDGARLLGLDLIS